MSTAPLPGISAQWPSQCPRCDDPIHKNDRIVFARGRAVHVACAAGQDDE